MEELLLDSNDVTNSLELDEESRAVEEAGVLLTSLELLDEASAVELLEELSSSELDTDIVLDESAELLLSLEEKSAVDDRSELELESGAVDDDDDE